MPLYEYECDANKHRFEVIRKFSDPPLETCPQCGSTVHKLFSSPAIQFKGSGWYITDYAKKDSGSSATDSADAKKDTPSTAAPAETKSSTAAGESKTAPPASPTTKTD